MVFDVIRRYLTFRGYRVTFVKNYTDVDDRIIKRANDSGVTAREFAERFITAEREDMASLGVLAPDIDPKATEHVPEMIELIGRLVAGGHAYPVEGDVYFAISSFAPYGRLSGKNLDDLLAGARVEVDERKRDPRDFALWKGAKPGEPSWDSPWGPGRPGWHIECSAMAMKYLGVSFDLHGGGEDLIFPHHECEIAQAEACTGKPFARYWVHNGMVNMGKEKMSKSLGNTLSIREIVKRHSPDTLRLWMLGTHYRNMIEWSEERVEESKRALERLTRLLHDAAAVRDGGARRRCHRHSRSSARASRRRWTTTSTRRRRSACSSISAERWPTRATGVPALPARSSRASTSWSSSRACSGSSAVAPRWTGRRRKSSSCSPRAARRGRAVISSAGTRSATRSRGSAGSSRTRRPVRA